jgi:F-type H+/Na+-transporting ATPase subunit alpha
MVELLKQLQYKPMSVFEQVISIYAATRGHMDDVPVDKIAEFETRLLEFMRDRKGEVMNKLQETKDLTAEVEEGIKSAIAEFKKGFKA